MTAFEQEASSTPPEMEVFQVNNDVLDTTPPTQELPNRFLEVSGKLLTRLFSILPVEAPQHMSKHFGHAEDRNDPRPDMLSYLG